MKKIRLHRRIAGLISLLVLSQAPQSALHAEVPMRGDDPAQTDVFTINLSDTGHAKGPTEAFLMAYFVGDSVEETQPYVGLTPLPGMTK